MQPRTKTPAEAGAFSGTAVLGIGAMAASQTSAYASVSTAAPGRQAAGGESGPPATGRQPTSQRRLRK